jgi:hypothetical protein
LTMSRPVTGTQTSMQEALIKKEAPKGPPELLTPLIESQPSTVPKLETLADQIAKTTLKKTEDVVKKENIPPGTTEPGKMSKFVSAAGSAAYNAASSIVKGLGTALTPSQKEAVVEGAAVAAEQTLTPENVSGPPQQTAQTEQVLEENIKANVAALAPTGPPSGPAPTPPVTGQSVAAMLPAQAQAPPPQKSEGQGFLGGLFGGGKAKAEPAEPEPLYPTLPPVTSAPPLVPTTVPQPAPAVVPTAAVMAPAPTPAAMAASASGKIQKSRKGALTFKPPNLGQAYTKGAADAIGQRIETAWRAAPELNIVMTKDQVKTTFGLTDDQVNSAKPAGQLVKEDEVRMGKTVFSNLLQNGQTAYNVYAGLETIFPAIYQKLFTI